MIGDTSRLRRGIGYGLIGATGIPVDLAIVWTATAAGAPYLAATILGYQLAVTWNYGWQRRLVFHSTQPMLREYIQYCGADIAGGLVRVAAVAALMETAVLGPLAAVSGVPAAVVASFAGIMLAFVVTFLAADTLVFTQAEVAE